MKHQRDPHKAVMTSAVTGTCLILKLLQSVKQNNFKQFSSFLSLDQCTLSKMLLGYNNLRNAGSKMKMLITMLYNQWQ